MFRSISALLPCLGLLVSGSARATGAKDFHRMLATGEVIVPDLRLEIGERAPAAVLSLPVHALVNRVGSSWHTPRDLWLSTFVEPQLQLANGEWRGLFGARGWVPFANLGSIDMALVVEASGLAATDGHGGAPGIGISGIGTGAFGMSFLGVVYRYVLTTEGNRHDISLDLLTIPL